MTELAKAIYLAAAYEMHGRKGGEPITRATYLHRQGWRIDPYLPLTSMGTLAIPNWR